MDGVMPTPMGIDQPWSRPMSHVLERYKFKDLRNERLSPMSTAIIIII